MITDACKDIDLVNQTRVRNKEQIEDIVFLSGEVDNLGEVGIVESFSNLSVEGRVFTVRGWTWTLFGWSVFSLFSHFQIFCEGTITLLLIMLPM